MTADAQSPDRPKAREESTPFTTDDAQNIFDVPRPTAPQPPPSASGPSFRDFTFDTLLLVPEALEPRMESILGKEIPELRWQDEAENWGKIRIMGTLPDSSPRVVVSIARKEPPGPFNLRIIVRGALEPAAEAFRKAITQRLELAIYAATKGTPAVTSIPSSFTIRFTPPFFSLESLFHVPETLEPGMALRIKAAIPELTWIDNAPDWEQVRIVASTKNPYQRTVVSILRGDPAGPYRLWMHTTAIHAATAQDVLTSLLDRILAASDAIPPDVTFDSQLSILEPQVPILESTLRERIPELDWRTHTENDYTANGDKLHVIGTPPGPTPRVLVSITREEPPGSFHITIHIRILIRGCFEVQAQAFHQAMLQRLHFSLCPSNYSHVRPSQPTPSQHATIGYPMPFVPPFFSLRAGVPVAEEFETDNMSAFVTRLRDNIPELTWIGLAEDRPEIRIAAERLGPAGILPMPNTIQRTCLSLLRRGPFSAFDLWIHITAASGDDADRALHLLEHRVRLVLRSQFAGPYVPLPGSPMTRVLPSDYPPIFHLNFRMEAPPPGLPLDIEFRLNDGTPGAPWKTIVHNGKRKGVYLKTENMHGFQLIYILSQPEPDRIRVIIDTTAESRERLEIFREYFIRKIQKALLNPIRRP